MSGTGSDRGTLAQAVADAVASVPGIARMSSGPGVPVGTQYAGGTVSGVKLRDELVVAHVVLDRLPVLAVTEPALSAAEAALRALGDSRPVELVVDDIVLEELDTR